jgi:hypothetical protein
MVDSVHWTPGQSAAVLVEVVVAIVAVAVIVVAVVEVVAAKKILFYLF